MDKLVKLPCGCLYGAKDQKVFSASPNCKDHHGGQQIVFGGDIFKEVLDGLGGDMDLSKLGKIIDGFK